MFFLTSFDFVEECTEKVFILPKVKFNRILIRWRSFRLKFFDLETSLVPQIILWREIHHLLKNHLSLSWVDYFSRRLPSAVRPFAYVAKLLIEDIKFVNNELIFHLGN